MEQLTLTLESEYIGKIKTLIDVFGNNDLFVDKFFDFHINRLKREIVQIQNDLNVYEQKYKLKSSDFFEKFETGQLGDNKEYIIWSGIYEMQQNCKQKLQKLL